MRLDAHPHAKAVLNAALASGPSHAYLFQGPAGTGKRATARRFAARLLGADEDRVMRGAHPDLTWVTPSGAHEMLRGDVDRAVVNAASHTPFEAPRRVFVLERADTLIEAAANTLLKTLEEPPSYVVLLLLTDRPSQVLPTIASRCQPVRFDAPSADEIASERGVPIACARLALGDSDRATFLATDEGAALRACAEAFVRAPARDKPWRGLLAVGAERAQDVRAALEKRRDEDLELVPKKERRRLTTEYEDRIRRADRRARTATVDHGLQLAGLWLRDLACVASGAPELAYNADRELDAGEKSAAQWRTGVELVEDTRARLVLNVSEELALEALKYRLERL